MSLIEWFFTHRGVVVQDHQNELLEDLVLHKLCFVVPVNFAEKLEEVLVFLSFFIKGVISEEKGDDCRGQFEQISHVNVTWVKNVAVIKAVASLQVNLSVLLLQEELRAVGFFLEDFQKGKTLVVDVDDVQVDHLNHNIQKNLLFISE